MEKMIFENAGVAVRNITPKPSSEIKPGAILSASWGWEQTNINFFMVKKVSNGWAVVVQLKNSSKGSDMYSEEMPTFQEVGEPMRRKMKYQDSLKISSFMYASLWDGKPEKATHYA